MAYGRMIASDASAGRGQRLGRASLCLPRPAEGIGRVGSRETHTIRSHSQTRAAAVRERAATAQAERAAQLSA